MVAYSEKIQVFCGNSNPEFAMHVCKELGIELGKSEVKTFADGEVSVTLEETVRGADVFLTGEVKYHDYFFYDDRILIAELGHYESEQYTKEIFKEIIHNIITNNYV